MRNRSVRKARGTAGSSVRLGPRFTLTLATLLVSGFSAVSPAASAAAGAEMTHGPVLGRPSSGGMSVWARTSRPAVLRVRYGEADRPLDQVSPAVRTGRAEDNTGVVDIAGLAPGRRYRYVVEVDGREQAPAGSFRTLHDPAALAEPEHNPRGLFNFAFEFACGNNQDPGAGLGPSLPAYDTLLRQVRDEVDFAVLNGDWLYEEARDYPPERWREQVGLPAGADLPPAVSVMPALAGLWENYKVYHARAPNLAEWHRHVPSFYTFDDHELLNDVFGCGTPGYRNRRAVFRDIGVRGWFDYLGWANPVRHRQRVHFGRARLEAGSDVLVDPGADFGALDWSAAANLHVHWGTPDAGVKDIPAGDVEGGDPNANIYEVVEVLDAHRLRLRPAAAATGLSSYSIGRHSYGSWRLANAHFFFLDTRTHRELHDLKNPGKPGLSLLGRAQREWLRAEMAASAADFFFLFSSVNFMIPHVGGGGHHFDAATKDDAWTVFLDEREALIRFWDGLGKPVFVLTGDLHNSFAIKVTERVWEFASGPHNSVNHRPVDEGNRPFNGRFQHGPRPCEIRWSTAALGDIPRPHRMFPHFCVVQVNNVFNNPVQRGGTRRVAFPRPQVIFRFHDALSGRLAYAETVLAAPAEAPGRDRR